MRTTLTLYDKTRLRNIQSRLTEIAEEIDEIGNEYEYIVSSELARCSLKIKVASQEIDVPLNFNDFK